MICERTDVTVIAQVTVFIGSVNEEFQLQETNPYKRHVGEDRLFWNC